MAGCKPQRGGARLKRIKKAAVLGAGVMGAAIAGHLANVGIPTLLLDIVPRDLTEEEKAKGLTLGDRVVRNRLAQKGKERLFKEKPSPLYTKEAADLIQVGNLEDDFDSLKDVDWIIEVVVENLKIKQDLFARIESVWKPGTVVSSNTSGISINKMVEGRSEAFRKHFLGTHFFNPPRYMKLLEIIPNELTDVNILREMKAFAEEVLGKGVVICKDTPNFIANRIGTYGLQVTLKAMEELGLGPDEVDDVTGRAMGRPKSATFRTLDLVGLDTFVHVADNVRENVTNPEEQEAFQVSPLLVKMVENKWLGEKTGQGFYKRVKTEKGKEILVLDPATLDYRPRKKLKARSLEQAKRGKTQAEKLRALVYANDPAGKLAWIITKKALLYTAEHLEEIADDIVSVDRAMRWGFNWDLGPFELWDAIGVEKSVARMREEGETIPPLVEKLLASGATSFYQTEEGRVQSFNIGGKFGDVDESEKVISLSRLKEQGKKIAGNKGASLIDIGDDIACLEFHSPKQAIGADIISMIRKAVKEVSANYRGLVISAEAPNFCVGANLMLMLMEAQDYNWPEIDLMVRQFQDAMGSLRYLDRPVVAAPYGMTLGGGVEVCMPCDRIQAAAETYMGLVEVGVGLIPGGGGNKEMLLRWTEGIDPGDRVALQPLVNHVFETIAQAKVSTSGPDAQKYKYLRPYDGITINRDHLLYEAKQVALGLYKAGYKAPKPRKIPVVGETGYNVLRLGAYGFLKSGYITEHDYKIAGKLAYVLAGGAVPEGTLVSEQYLLDLEREAFLSLIGEPKTQARMQYMLAKGKPLRN
ncbi:MULTISPECIES: 3-hydroxyacyl-CoA dehydrogenase/enoyl-CoA hydratase family protein [Thermoactinomyces]|uniref:3-hydroxyacyl-CoA dehydrogenase n=1 Tax=Thermoactinomyces daqus TaxID=1329516 RepID=A0A7W1XB43_9BACL|nr:MULTISPECIES: 3-hydroxyacyl-CoA dehydrogenase/enoyl-CoA hydratase family protein [Thermoactinomyces]MBA4543337.1 3-hydroxyacyl-CoA dehydrogenase [Thermoactinomyces daqus]MBH8598477.1 3-hydroxyacyl-CoA dehydrogenase [Thermoactinomyces sp. CICC 10523]MBH8604678.1 3-hydroxyacyl-CoA dehydrogenase [Thermoactinomyces sp. CICC 10522]